MAKLIGKDFPFVWSRECEEGFASLKEMLTIAPVFALPEQSEPYLVYTDATCNVIAYALRKLQKHENNYPTHDLEMTTVRKLNLRLRRWMELVADYDIEIAYHPGKANLVADTLSWKRAISAQEQDMETLVGEISALRLCVVSQELLGLEEVDRAYLLSRMRLAQENDVGLVNASEDVDWTRYIDKHWLLKKLIIGFKYVLDHKGKTIANTLLQCLADWGIEKVFTVTVDNATANSNALSEFQSTFSLIRTDSLVLNGDYMHMRCVGHIINLIVKDGMAEMDTSVTSVRTAISYVRSGPNRRKAFELRVETGRFTKGSLPLNVTTRWNSTYLMLTKAIKFKGAFDRMEFATLVVIASNTLNAHKCYSEIINIAVKLQLLCLNNDDDVKVNAEKMYKKFEKYWDGIKNINIMLVIASVFDPRKKMEFANLCFAELYGEYSTTAKGLNEAVLIVMRAMYKEYSERYAESTSQASGQSQSSSQAT
ncbi:PREDICTED: zinc finger BED domain-containing protein RICESLEEPER 2-like [Camelina sativa]|uniref:Zinc finger BED domain-containing protein RICESLEEPER 2-like n=1 Tax=Camelina sativa TaxID=90675 RepID=A0ABM0VYP8_CAMSA|nr:PREDICTED: zinc finger BED domain-containing protein RICESLEEPER 2-like [Camelina sativa]